MRTFLWLVIATSVAALAAGSFATDGRESWWDGMNITATVVIIVATMVLPFAGTGWGSRRAFRGAPIGIGAVVSVRRTGLSVNDQPQLEILLDIDTPDGQSFRGVARQFVDVVELGAFVPGMTLPVRYLPGRRDGRVVLAADASQAELQSVYNLVQLARGHLDTNSLRIAEHGLDARAVVLAMRPTGQLRDDRSVLDLTLRVTRPDGSTFDVYTEKAVPPALVPRVQPGSVIGVKYLPGDESAVALSLPMRQV